jgi:hypothetical protein
MIMVHFETKRLGLTMLIVAGELELRQERCARLGLKEQEWGARGEGGSQREAAADEAAAR